MIAHVLYLVVKNASSNILDGKLRCDSRGRGIRAAKDLSPRESC
jgi:hypothetical protein